MGPQRKEADKKYKPQRQRNTVIENIKRDLFTISLDQKPRKHTYSDEHTDNHDVIEISNALKHFYQVVMAMNKDKRTQLTKKAYDYAVSGNIGEVRYILDNMELPTAPVTNIPLKLRYAPVIDLYSSDEEISLRTPKSRTMKKPAALMPTDESDIAPRKGKCKRYLDEDDEDEIVPKKARKDTSVDKGAQKSTASSLNDLEFIDKVGEIFRTAGKELAKAILQQGS